MIGTRVFAAFLISAGVGLAQGSMQNLSSAGKFREVMVVLRQLEAQYGWRLNYEDPPYECPCELVDTVPPAVRASHPGASFLAPIPRPLNVSFLEPANIAAAAERIRVVDAVLAAHGQNVFKAFHEADVSHIAPRTRRLKDGTVTPFLPMLDTPVTFPAATRTVGDTVHLIQAQVAATRGIPIIDGVVPNNVFHNRKVTAWADHEPARTVLQRIFDYDPREFLDNGLSLPSPLVWDLLYDANVKEYCLSWNAVPKHPSAIEPH